MTTAIELTYRDRIALLREKKLRQTAEKYARQGSRDADDHGSVAPPADFHWTPIANHPSGSFFGPDGWAANFRSIMEIHPIYVDPLDALAGRFMMYLGVQQRVSWRPEFDCSHLREEQRRYGIVSGIGAPQHFAPDYRIGLELGWGGLLEKIRQHHSQLGPEQQAFLQAEEDCVLGIQTWMRRTLETIQAMEAAEADPALRDNLREMAETNAWIIDNPPRTLREACQWMAWFNMASRLYNGDGAGCQLDAILRPYYERDVAEGRLDDEKAIYIIACLLLNDAQYYQLGGPGADGQDVASQLSFLILEAGHRLGIPCNLTIRVHEGMNHDLFLTGVRHLFEDRQGWPRFSGDKGLVEGFIKNGYPVELARQRIAVGCHWMAIPGREYTLNDCVKINVGKVFETAFREMMDAGEPSTDALWARFDRHLQRAVRCVAEGLDFHLDHQSQTNPELLISLLCHGTLEQGLDASGGGVEMYNMCVDGSALATVADSFAALEQRIEREGRLRWDEVTEHLRENFAGTAGERVRLMLRSSARYGAGESLGDAWAQRISRRFSDIVKAAPTPEGRNMIPGWFSWSNTIGMGKELGATPNGRRAGEPISHGANPDPGFRSDGAPTAMARAIAAVQPGWGNTAPIQLELDPGISKEEGGIERVASLIKTHFDLGGTLFNINVLDKEKLLAAHADPSRYPDLVVRVTGFTAFFAVLSPEFRQLVINRFIAEGGV